MSIEENITLEKAGGRASVFRAIKQGDKIEQGRSGFVNECDVAKNYGDKEREHSLVAKTFHSSKGAERAFDAYCKVKAAGLKVPPTYRIDRENNKIYMTNYNRGGNVALSATCKNTQANGLIISEISNLDNLILDLEKQCVLAAEKDIRLPVDSFFFLTPRNGGSVEMDYVFGDFDRFFYLAAEDLNLDDKGLIEENIENARKALKEIIRQFVRKS
jgi:hypothetical protein